MEKSEQINELAAALVLAQGVFPAVLRGGTNPHLKNKYATLDDVIGAIRGPLCTQSLSFLQLIDQGSDGTILTTMLLHKSGQFISATANVEKMAGNRAINDMQSLGAALTYMKRYQLSALLGLNTETDNDGNGKRALSKSSAVKVNVSEASVKWALEIATPNGKTMAEAAPENLKYVLAKPDEYTPDQVKAARILMHAKAKPVLARLRAKQDKVAQANPDKALPTMDDITTAMTTVGPGGRPLGKYDRAVWGQVASARPPEGQAAKYTPELKRCAAFLFETDPRILNEWREEHGNELDAIAAQDSDTDQLPEEEDDIPF